MKKISKNDLELLKDLLNRLIEAKKKDEHFLGLCGFINKHFKHVPDYSRLLRIIRDSEPKGWYYVCFIQDGGYYWKAGDINPRIKFVKKLIKKYS